MASKRHGGKKKHMDAHPPLKHNDMHPALPQSSRAGKILWDTKIVLFILIGFLFFLGLNIAAFYYGWKSGQTKSNAVIESIHTVTEMVDSLGKRSSQSDTGKRDEQNRIFACDPVGVCNNYADPQSMGCPKTFRDPFCEQQCDTIKNRCKL